MNVLHYAGFAGELHVYFWEREGELPYENDVMALINVVVII